MLPAASANRLPGMPFCNRLYREQQSVPKQERRHQAAGAKESRRFAESQMLKIFLNDQSGAMLAEYALMLAILCLGSACAMYFLGDAISDAFAGAAQIISSEWELAKSGAHGQM